MPSGPVAIILLNYQGAKHTAACLATLRPSIDYAEARGHGPFEVLVIDNNSDIEDVAFLVDHLASLPWVTLIQNAENVGFSRGVNQGIRWAAERGAESVLLLNNDTLLEENALHALCDQAAPDRLLTSLILQYPAHDKIWAFGGRVTWGAVPGALGFYGRTLAELPPKLLEANLVSTEFCTGCVLLIPMALMRGIGLFDETYFAYVEDVDFSLRAKAHGVGSYVVPASKVYHRSAASTGGSYNARGRYLMGFGTAVCARQHANAWQKLKTHALMRVAVLVAHFREARTAHADAPLAKWRGYRDGLKVELKRPPRL
ncbi:MAG: glycosyltransferase family 2 protein [bacterium]